MTTLIIVGILVGSLVVLGLCIWAVANSIESGIKGYIDYARKDKEDDRP